ncbi:type II secretion system F family protein [Halorhabdus sp. CUG00001]|uniref:type II secretion system F family protein n=1 Tax=Halorhabdus sp. CUG00001 TaxID=2600297 RepID=UPI00131DB988|nr:type II secretion system F family protein [Halorhabdus sp. CUG00001]
MSVVGYLPLVVAVTIAAAVASTRLSKRLDRLITRIARRYFSRYVPASAERRRLLESAYVDTTYRVYAAKTYLYTATASVVGGVIGVYAVGAALVVLPIVAGILAELPSVMGEVLGERNMEILLSPNQVFFVLTAGGVVFGVLSAILTYVLRWQLPSGHAEVRRRGINEALPRTVAFVYALARGGMAFPEVMRTLGRNRAIYGDAADEMSVAVREMDLFGRDMISAVRRTAHRSPSDPFRTFAENLASVLSSGQKLPQFLEDQYERLQEEAEQRQAEVLELLATIAEAYVTTLVAGVLFLFTILLVFGLTITDTLPILQMLAYVIVPLSNALFVVYLAQKLEELGVARESGLEAIQTGSESATRMPNTASSKRSNLAYAAAGRAQLALYDRVARIKRVLRQPVQTILWNPSRVFYITVPIALLWVAISLPAAVTEYGFNLRLADDVFVQVTIFLIGTYAIVRELYTRRIDRIEAATPELLERLASLNEAGMSFVESVDRVRDTDLGMLTDEVNRIWTDMSMGANASNALRRFGRRVRTSSTARVVSLLTNAMKASGKLGPVLRIAATQARSDLRMRRERRQQMFTYLVVIYVSFLVFLVIIFAVQEVLVPSLPNNVPVPDQSNRLGVDVTAFARLGQVNKPAYTLVFLHAALIQGVLSGFIAGQLGEGTLKDGAKHAAILLTIAYVLILVASSPVASLTMQNQQAIGQTVTIDSVSTSEGGFVVVHERTKDGQVVGQTGYLPPGEHTNVVVEIDEPIRTQATLVAVPHQDTDDDERLSYAGGSLDHPYRSSDGAIAVDARIDPPDDGENE